MAKPIKSMPTSLLLALALSGGYVAEPAARSYLLDDPNDMLIGRPGWARTTLQDDLPEVARRHGFGYQDVALANPDVDVWLPGEGQKIRLPSRFILPDAPRSGIVLNIPEMRLYYYPPRKKNSRQEVITHPLGIGKQGWSTPYVNTYISEKKVRPNWYPPKSIRLEWEKAGATLPEIVEAGPDNPLGDYAMRLGLPNYLIHGTNKPYGVGLRVSHGCIRLYPENIESLFNKVSVRTPVNIINQPYKIGVQNHTIYLEVHPFMQEDARQHQNNRLANMAKAIERVIGNSSHEIDWAVVRQAIDRPNGIPVAIGILMPGTTRASTEPGITARTTSDSRTARKSKQQ